MIFFYIDESGTSLDQKPDPKNKQTNFFLMANVGIHAQNIAEIDGEFSLLKRHIYSKLDGTRRLGTKRCCFHSK